MISRLIRKLERRDVLSDEERQVLEGAVTRVKEARMDEDLVRDGERLSESTLLLEGFAAATSSSRTAGARSRPCTFQATLSICTAFC